MRSLFVYLVLAIGSCAARRLINNDPALHIKDRAIERLSKVFGLPVNSGAVPTRDPPQYMVDLYNSVADSNGVTRSKNPYNATIIRSFLNKGSIYSDVMYFDVSGINPTEHILQAELHLHRHKQRVRSHKSRNYILQVKVYQVTDVHYKHMPERNRLISTNYIDVATSGWDIVSITSAVADWTSGKSPNYGLLISVSSFHGHSTELRPFDDDNHHYTAKTPILVVFSSETAKTSLKNHVPTKYEDLNSSADYDGLLTNSLDRKKRSAPVMQETEPRQREESCQLANMYVDFETIGWTSWIISPKGYNAYHCRGVCSFPLGQNQRPTNHATVQSIVSQLELVPGVRQPCCVPNKLLSLTLLYFDDQDNVVLKQYDDMVADGCGCH